MKNGAPVHYSKHDITYYDKFLRKEVDLIVATCEGDSVYVVREDGINFYLPRKGYKKDFSAPGIYIYPKKDNFGWGAEFDFSQFRVRNMPKKEEDPLDALKNELARLREKGYIISCTVTESVIKAL